MSFQKLSKDRGHLHTLEACSGQSRLNTSSLLEHMNGHALAASRVMCISSAVLLCAEKMVVVHFALQHIQCALVQSASPPFSQLTN